ncbi:hypothetical protein GCM10022278_37640 [Allohahella marinimesophila]|uniref:Transposase n=1 Tax=Allohahella marinimesophila TaxID=1054972 RepID=A0ABP7Q6K8_9GAMM
MLLDMAAALPVGWVKGQSRGNDEAVLLEVWQQLEIKLTQSAKAFSRMRK